MIERLIAVRESARILGGLSDQQRRSALIEFASLIEEHSEQILKANADDIDQNRTRISSALLQRLTLSKEKLKILADGVRKVSDLSDPIGKITLSEQIGEAINLQRVTVPLGVVAIVFESRPDVIPQVLSLLLRSGNAAILKPGSEAISTAREFLRIIEKLNSTIKFLPKDWALFLESREEFQEVLNYPEHVDLVIPRGSNQLVQSIMNSTKIPVLGHADGVCHLYLHSSADLDMAIKVILNSKAQYPAACNAVETVLLDQVIAAAFFKLFDKAASEIKIYGCERSCELFSRALPHLGDWHVEFGEPILAIKIVDSVSEAIDHINTYGSHHTDAIIADDKTIVEEFLRSVDSACVFSNISTRFSDGYRFGFGAEIGISTSKIHARGPVGLEGLVTYKYIARGTGEVV